MWAMAYDAPGNGVYVPALLKELSEAAGDRAIFTCDVGQHQMWVAQHCRFTRPQAHLTSAGLGPSSEERRVGKECFSTGRSRGSRCNSKKKKTIQYNKHI